MKCTFYGHACFLLDTGRHKILFDPFIRGNEKAAHINVDSIEADFILLSHGHVDHIAETEEIAKRCRATVVSNYEVAMYFGAKECQIHPMNHGGSWSFDFGRVHYVQAVHTSSLPDGGYGGQPGGFVIEFENMLFYYSGDTAVTLDMTLIPEMIGPIDFSVLPIGGNFTMDHKGAIKTSELIQCKRVLGIHFDTFGYIEVDHEEVKADFKKAGIDFTMLAIGESMNI